MMRQAYTHRDLLVEPTVDGIHCLWKADLGER